MLFILFNILISLIYGDLIKTGGAKCHNNTDCNGIGYNITSVIGGICILRITNKTNILNKTIINNYCECNIDWGNQNCTYKRLPKELGILQFVSLIGIGGLGNIVIGNTQKGFIQLCISIISLSCVILFIVLTIMLTRMNYIIHEDKKNWIKDFNITVICRIILVIIIIQSFSWVWNINDGLAILNKQIVDVNGYNFY
jgi:hypothetical protein